MIRTSSEVGKLVYASLSIQSFLSVKVRGNKCKIKVRILCRAFNSSNTKSKLIMKVIQKTVDEHMSVEWFVTVPCILVFFFIFAKMLYSVLHDCLVRLPTLLFKSTTEWISHSYSQAKLYTQNYKHGTFKIRSNRRKILVNTDGLCSAS